VERRQKHDDRCGIKVGFKELESLATRRWRPPDPPVISTRWCCPSVCLSVHLFVSLSPRLCSRHQGCSTPPAREIYSCGGGLIAASINATHLLVSSQYQRVSDRQRDRQTDTPPMPMSCSSIAERDKKLSRGHDHAPFRGNLPVVAKLILATIHLPIKFEVSNVSLPVRNKCPRFEKWVNWPWPCPFRGNLAFVD